MPVKSPDVPGPLESKGMRRKAPANGKTRQDLPGSGVVVDGWAEDCHCRDAESSPASVHENSDRQTLLELWSRVRHIGIDEAGRGCLAGPVVAAAVLFPENFAFERELAGLADSKKLNEKKRTRLRVRIEETAIAFGIGLSWQDEIDTVNILNATFRAMSRAVLLLSARLEDSGERNADLPCLLVDGNKEIPAKHWNACLEPFPPLSGRFAQEQAPLIVPENLCEQHGRSACPVKNRLATERAVTPAATGVPPAMAAALAKIYRTTRRLRVPQRIPSLGQQLAIVDGDDLMPSISAASILAKTARDELMAALDRICPGYEFSRHKGYGTRLHRELLVRLGPSPLHRRSFRLHGEMPVSPDLDQL